MVAFQVIDKGSIPLLRKPYDVMGKAWAVFEIARVGSTPTRVIAEFVARSPCWNKLKIMSANLRIWCSGNTWHRQC